MRTFPKTHQDKAFLAEVKARRRALRIPQKVLAYELGISPARYARIERGASPLIFAHGKFLAQRLEIKIEK